MHFPVVKTKSIELNIKRSILIFYQPSKKKLKKLNSKMVRRKGPSLRFDSMYISRVPTPFSQEIIKTQIGKFHSKRKILN